MEKISDLIKMIALTGRGNQSYPLINEIEIFSHFFDSEGKLDRSNLDKREGSCTRRELLMRFLVLSAVIDQGPDIVGVRKLLQDVTNALYRREIRFLHTPLDFFKEIGISIDEILDKHGIIKKLRGKIWAKENQSNPDRYNLFMDNSKQVLNYAVFRWGVPLALPLLLERDTTDEQRKPTVLADYLDSWPSAEAMTIQLKDNERYGLGKAIGDKACHLFAKWMVTCFNLNRNQGKSWGPFSYEVPFDSNAGRVLWRTGYFLDLVDEETLVNKSVINRGQGKQGLDYIRVTNIRGIGIAKQLPSEIIEAYVDISCNHLKTHTRSPKKVEIQRVQHAYLLSGWNENKLSIADFDEGLIHIGTHYCFNHSEPICEKCPIAKYCEGKNSRNELITKYRT